MKTHLFILTLLALSMVLVGCPRAYDTTMEVFGKRKKDILLDRIVVARDAQSNAKERFASALDEFRAVAGYKGTLLEEKYRSLKSRYEQCQAQTRTVESRLDDVRRAAKSMFRQWEDELDQYSSDIARKSSEEKLKRMQIRYEALINVMEQARNKLYPALSAFKDQVLLLRHNLNIQNEVSMAGELEIIEKEIAVLIQEIDRSTFEVDSFVRQMRLE